MSSEIGNARGTTVASWLREEPVGNPRNVLVVQGGGMRGVYSMGALTALEDAGLRNAFGLVIGSSAGAINAAYFLTGQARAAVTVYVDYLSNRHFVNFARFWRIVDIDYLVDMVLKIAVPIEINSLRDSPCRLEVILTDAETAEPFVVTNRQEDADFYEVIRATAALPALYNRKIIIGSRAYVDGGVADTVPVMRAVEAGADRLVAVVTRSPGYRRTNKSWFVRSVSRALAHGQSAAVKSVIGVEDARFNDAMDLLEHRDMAHLDVTSWVVWPSDPERLVSRTTFDKAALRECARMGHADMTALLARPYEESADELP